METLNTQQWINEELIPWLLDPGLRIILIIFVALLIKKFSKGVITRAVRKSVPPQAFLSKKAESKREDTLIAIFNGAFSVILWLVVILMILSEVNIDIGPLLAGAGIAGVAFGFGAQYLVRDIINGMFIVLENQFRVGDVVKFGEISGTVEGITLRTTVLRDMDGIVHHIPNGEIKIASNMSKDFSSINLDVGVSYEADIDQVANVINHVGTEITEDPEWSEKIKTAPSFLRIEKLADSAVVVKIVGEVEPLQQWAVTGELRKRIKLAFDAEGIEIPYPQRVIRHVDSDES